MAASESRSVSLPLTRIKLIMKSSPDVSSINQDSLMLTAKATELFVKFLASYAYKHGSGKDTKTLTYDDLADAADESETFQFLSDILPKKILASEYLELLKKEEEGGDDDDEEEEEEEEDDDDDDDEEDDDDDDDDDEEEDDDDEEDDEN
ncbi:chromatin accessibility complex protein 1 [Rhinophrynus dorsalis]